VPGMGLVTKFCPLTTIGPGTTCGQTACETRFVVDCEMNPMALAGYTKINGSKFFVGFIGIRHYCIWRM